MSQKKKDDKKEDESEQEHHVKKGLAGKIHYVQKRLKSRPSDQLKSKLDTKAMDLSSSSPELKTTSLDATPPITTPISTTILATPLEEEESTWAKWQVGPPQSTHQPTFKKHTSAPALEKIEEQVRPHTAFLASDSPRQLHNEKLIKTELERDKYKRELGHMKNQLEEYEKEIVQYRTQQSLDRPNNNNNNNKIEELRYLLEECNDCITHIEKEEESKENEIQVMKTRIEELEDENEKLNQTIYRMKEEMKQQEVTARVQMEKEKENLEMKHAVELNELHQGKQKEIEKLKYSLTESNNELSAVKTKAAHDQGKVAFLEKRLQSKEKEYENQIILNEKLTQELIEAKTNADLALQIFEQEKESNEELRQQVNELDKERNKKQEIIQMKEAKIKELIQFLREKDETILAAQEQVTTEKEEKEKVEKELKNEKATAARTILAMETKKTELEEIWREEIRNTEQQTVLVNQKVAQLSSTLTAQKTKKKHYKDQMRKKEEELERAQDQLEEIMKEVEERRQIEESLREDIRLLQNKDIQLMETDRNIIEASDDSLLHQSDSSSAKPSSIHSDTIPDPPAMSEEDIRRLFNPTKEELSEDESRKLREEADRALQEVEEMRKQDKESYRQSISYSQLIINNYTKSVTPRVNPLLKDLEEIEKEAQWVRDQSKRPTTAEVEADNDDSSIPFDPNLVCPKCSKRYRIGGIQMFKRHVKELCPLLQK